MGISVTEYLGHRTDNDSDLIQAQSSRNKICPFNALPCEKIVKGNKPVCSVRNFGRKRTIPPDQLGENPFWIVCEHRLCSTSMKKVHGVPSLTDHQIERLMQIAKVVFEDSASISNVFVRSEVSIKVNDERRQDMHADYVMTYTPEHPDAYEGKKKLIIEMQGGGETSSTGNMTRHVDNWEHNAARTNEGLRSLISKVGILATNAWRRQQEQALVKSNVSEKTPNVDGFVLCVGSCLYNYLNTKLNLDNLACQPGEDWKVAIISFKENHALPISDGPIPLAVDKVIKIPTYMSFISAITSQGKSTPEAFRGEFLGLDNQRRVF